MMMRTWLLPVLLCVLISSSASAAPPEIPREFRAVWVATVANIDWPSEPGLSTEKQQAELIELFNKAMELGFNAVIFQVRPACDAIYSSPFEPWSYYVSGKMGEPPEGDFDPLAFSVKLAHDRGIELHAWFNPFRALHAGARDIAVSDNHISKTHPEWVREYGKYLWLDPGEPSATEHSLNVIEDVVRRYDVDGIHIDDYFYPYPIEDDQEQEIPFPDDDSYARSGVEDSLTKDEWRRQNVDHFVEQMYRRVKQTKPWVRVGVSPFGIWRPGHPEGITGFDAYDKIYADAKKWVQQGWLDYASPQLYWKIASEGQSYPRLLGWWVAHNSQKRHMWPGNFTSMLGDEKIEKRWQSQEIVDQIRITREQSGATGNVHFSMKAFMKDYENINDSIALLYAKTALVPASDWLDAKPPAPPQLTKNPNGSVRVTNTDERTQWFVIQTQLGQQWTCEVVSADDPYQVNPTSSTIQAIYVTPVSRTSVLGQAVKINSD